MKAVNFLDITLNLTTETYQPYTKPNDRITYVNSNSNHPRNILKALPDNISLMINKLYSTENIFNNTKGTYDAALSESGYETKLKYRPELKQPNETNRRNRARKVIWFNPPYSMNVVTNVAKRFLGLICKHFPQQHRLHKIFNKNNMKVSYSCLPNMNNIINAHNKRILHPTNASNIPSCNCRKKDECPLEGKCLQRNVIYKCQVSTNEDECVSYIGCTENTFKDRLYKHRNSFKYKTKRNCTVFQLLPKNKSEKYNIEQVHEYHKLTMLSAVL